MFLVYRFRTDYYDRVVKSDQIPFMKQLVDGFYQGDPYGSIHRLRVVKSMDRFNPDPNWSYLVFPSTITADRFHYFNPEPQLGVFNEQSYPSKRLIEYCELDNGRLFKLLMNRQKLDDQLKERMNLHSHPLYTRYVEKPPISEFPTNGVVCMISDLSASEAIRTIRGKKN